MSEKSRIANLVRLVRSLQLQIERDIRSKKFKIPVHLAIGHEAIAVAIASVSEGADSIFLTHRNIHFQIALGASLQQIRDEYLLEPTGLSNHYKPRLSSTKIGSFGVFSIISESSTSKLKLPE